MAAPRSQLSVSTKALLLGALIFCACAVARAQPAAEPAAPAPPAPQEQPAAAQPAPASETPSQAPPVPQPPPAQPAPAAAAPSADPVPAGVPLDPEAAALARRHWLMRARAEQAAERDEEPEPPRVRGDAGAPFAIGIGVDTQLHEDPSYDLFDDDDLAPAFSLWVAYDVLELGPGVLLAAELAWQLESQDADDLLGGALESELTDNTITGGLQLRFVPAAVFQPHLRLAGGASIVAMELRTNRDRTFTDGGAAPLGSLGIGFTLRTPTRMFERRNGGLASLSFGLMVEAGYTLAGPVALTLDGEAPGERAIPITESELGELKRSGPYLRGSLVTRF